MEILFWLRKKRNSSNKTITTRLTICGSRKDFSTGIDIDPKYWLGHDFQIHNSMELNVHYNETLSSIKTDLTKAYNALKREGLEISVETVYERFLILNRGLEVQPEKKQIPTIMDMINLAMKRKHDEIGIKIKESSYQRYDDYKDNLLSYFKREKIDPWHTPITAFTLDLCNHFLKTLVTVEKKAPTTANKHKEVIRIIANAAHYEADGWTLKLQTKDLNSHIEPEPDTTHLTMEEIKKIEKHTFIGKLDRARDMLLFLCEIGQHIGDYTNLVRFGEIEIDQDGDQWLTIIRQKTNVKAEILLSKRAIRLLAKYGGLRKLPVISDQKGNDYLKLIAMHCGIDKNFSTKLGRKTFSHHRLNTDGLDRMVVAKMIGLKNDKYLRHYAKENRETMKKHWMQRS